MPRPEGLEPVKEASPLEEWQAEDDDEECNESCPLTRFESRVTEPEKGLVLVRTTRTVASVLFGNGSSFERSLYRYSLQSSLFTIVPFVLWYIGATLGLLALVNILPRACIWASTLMIPLPFLAFLLLCKDLLVQVLAELEFYVLMILQSVLLAAAVLLLRDDRCVFWWCFAPTMCIAGLVDAYPARFRALFSQCFFAGVTTVFVMWNLMLVFNWCSWENRLYHVGHITGSVAACSFTTQSTVLLFFLRHFFCSFVHQDRFVLIRSHIRTRIAELNMTVDSEKGRADLQEVAAPRIVRYSESVNLSAMQHGHQDIQSPKSGRPGSLPVKQRSEQLQRLSTSAVMDTDVEKGTKAS